jgi:glc operon protein GlcG
MMERVPVLGDAEAMRAVLAIRAEAARRGVAAVIAVADAHGELLAFLRMAGAPLESGPIATNKAFTAARLRKPSRALGESVRAKGHDTVWWGDPRYLGWGGGMPVAVEGQVVGAVAVSGLSQDEDEELANLGIAAALGDGA